MHLSLLSDATLSDLLDDAGQRDRSSRDGIARQHFDGLLRGMVFAFALLAPFALTFAPVAFDHPHRLLAGFEMRP